MIAVELRKLFRRRRTWATIGRLNALLVQAGIPVTGLALERPSLEEVVLAATGTSTDRVEARP